MDISQSIDRSSSEDTRMAATLYLDRPEGRIAYDSTGEGPLIVCIPGMGDLRSSYRYLIAALAAAGYRVVTTDLRGHGESDAGFSDYGDEATASDVSALIDELGAPAIVIGNSMGAGSAVLAAAADPSAIGGLVLIGPFVRDPATSWIMRLTMRAAMAAPWAAAVWSSYLPKLYAGTTPPDFDEYRASVVAAIRRPGYARAFSQTTRTSHIAAEQALSSVSAPTLVIMGAVDPDFPDPSAEASWIAARLDAEVELVPEAGHYPHSQRPDVVVPAVMRFVAAQHA
jgi:pimeloyl-ACP methyl ester carboxylesterase